MSRSIEQAHRSLDALAAWSTGGPQARTDVNEALALARIELSRIQDLASSVSSLASRPKSFLVVDDSADMRFIVARLIRRIARTPRSRRPRAAARRWKRCAMRATAKE